MVLDIQTVHHILKTYSSSKCEQTVCLHYGLDFPFKKVENLYFEWESTGWFFTETAS